MGFFGGKPPGLVKQALVSKKYLIGTLVPPGMQCSLNTSSRRWDGMEGIEGIEGIEMG